jgi:2-polyprenyl-6-methoxyphenol hydroxylase-like FAD-dependent oxidoreductase
MLDVLDRTTHRSLATSEETQTATPPLEKRSDVLKTDVAIIGAGMAGATAALLLRRRGVDVAVIDPAAVYPRDFRCEKLTAGQLKLVDDLGLSDCFTGAGTKVKEAVVARGGRIVERRQAPELCLSYEDMVNAVRRAWPDDIRFIQDQAVSIETSGQNQSIVLASGAKIDARLVVLATGPSDKLRAQLGMKRRRIDHRSLCAGINLTPAAGQSFPFQALTYFGEHAGDGMAFASFFPFGACTRVNLFCYKASDDAWTGMLRNDPVTALYQAMPGLKSLLGAPVVIGKPQVHATQLFAVKNHLRDGVVLAGEAFRPSCPVTGSGVTRVLTDAGQLCNLHIPNWLASPGMGADKIAQFYDDPVKQQADGDAVREAARAYAFATKTDLPWRVRRNVTLAVSRLRGFMQGNREACRVFLQAAGSALQG